MSCTRHNPYDLVFNAARGSVGCLLHTGRYDANGRSALDYCIDRVVLKRSYDTLVQDTIHVATGNGYRFAFNGKEQDSEWNGGGNMYDYGFRIYDPRIAKFLSVDPLTSSYPWYTPYQFAGNMPIWAIDLDGLEEYIVINRYYDDGSLGFTSIRIVKAKPYEDNGPDSRSFRRKHRFHKLVRPRYNPKYGRLSDYLVDQNARRSGRRRKLTKYNVLVIDVNKGGNGRTQYSGRAELTKSEYLVHSRANKKNQTWSSSGGKMSGYGVTTNPSLDPVTQRELGGTYITGAEFNRFDPRVELSNNIFSVDRMYDWNLEISSGELNASYLFWDVNYSGGELTAQVRRLTENLEVGQYEGGSNSSVTITGYSDEQFQYFSSQLQNYFGDKGFVGSLNVIQDNTSATDGKADVRIVITSPSCN